MSDVRNADLSSLKINRAAPSKQVPQSGGSRNRALIAGGIGVLIAAGLLAMFRMMFSAEEVETITAVRSSLSQANSVLTASGYVVAQRKAAVSSKLTGRLVQLSVIEGDEVKTGQIIARIESADVEAILAQMRASLDAARADVLNAQAEVDDARLDLDRKTSLAAQKAISQMDADVAKARHNKALALLAARKASVGVAEANLRNAQVQVENTIIRAPFDGKVLTKNANVGEVITALGAAAGSRGAVVTIADMNSLEVEADVSESSIERTSIKQPCEITLDAFPEQRYQGFVGTIIPTADRAKATVMLKIRFTNRDKRVLPEMSAKVSFLKPDMPQDAPSSAPPQIMISSTAVVMRDGRKVVFRVSGEKSDKAVQMPVKTGVVTGSLVAITEGLNGGERLVLRPSEQLRDGAAVRLKEK
jgi:RND family efflux transporter MFP subunit